MYIYIYIYIYIHKHIHIHIHIHVHITLQTYVCVCLCVFAYVFVSRSSKQALRQSADAIVPLHIQTDLVNLRPHDSPTHTAYCNIVSVLMAGSIDQVVDWEKFSFIACVVSRQGPTRQLVCTSKHARANTHDLPHMRTYIEWCRDLT